MATRKPDWANREVEQSCEMVSVKGLHLVKPVDAAALLRTHHRKVKRVVLEVGKDFSWSTSVASAIRDILDKLKELEQ